jgi:hypothetical protein
LTLTQRQAASSLMNRLNRSPAVRAAAAMKAQKMAE